MKLHYKKIELPFEYPFTISGGRTKTHQPSLIVALQLGNFVGYGEAPAITYYNIAVEYLKLKSVIAMAPLTDEQITDKKFASTVVKAFEALHPLIVFLNNALEN